MLKIRLLSLRIRILIFVSIIICILFTFINPAFADMQDYTQKDTPRKVAVLFGMADYDGNATNLSGPVNDVIGMKSVLEQTGYEVYDYMNLAAEAVLTNIDTAVSGMTSADTLLFFYSGHGSNGGYLYCSDGNTISIIDLETALGQHGGTKVVLIDSCYSGDFIAKNSIEGTEIDFKSAEEFNDYIISVFREKDELYAKDLTQSGYKVLTASTGNTSSYEIPFSKPNSTFAANYYTPKSIYELN